MFSLIYNYLPTFGHNYINTFILNLTEPLQATRMMRSILTKKSYWICPSVRTDLVNVLMRISPSKCPKCHVFIVQGDITQKKF